MSMISFPILIETITVRIGQDYLIMGSGMVFFVVQVSSAVNVYLFGVILNSEEEVDTIYCIYYGVALITVAYILTFISDIFENKPFVKKRSNVSQSQSSPSIKDTVKVQLNSK